jgi:hypothetical protein
LPCLGRVWIIEVVVSRAGRVHLQVRLSDGFRLSEEALIVIGGRISVRDQAGRRLEATIPLSLKSLGEKVDVEVLGIDGDVLVHVKSASRMPMTLIDWGKNADNILRFTNWLAKTEAKA